MFLPLLKRKQLPTSLYLIISKKFSGFLDSCKISHFFIKLLIAFPSKNFPELSEQIVIVGNFNGC